MFLKKKTSNVCTHISGRERLYVNRRLRQLFAVVHRVDRVPTTIVRSVFYFVQILILLVDVHLSGITVGSLQHKRAGLLRRKTSDREIKCRD